MKIVHIITGLGDGGAEHVLFKICKYDLKNKHVVISLTNKGKYYSLLNKIGIEVYCLNLSFFSILKIFNLIKLLKYLRPDLVQTWLVHADFIGSISARLAGIKKIIWNIRYSNIEIRKAKFFTVLIINILSAISHIIPKYIFVVSKKAKKIYETKGYSKKKLIYVPNGYDLSILKIDNALKKKFRKKTKIDKKIFLIGNVARYDPQKDHFNLIKALALLNLKKIKFFCVLIGSNMDKKNNQIISKIKELKLSKKIKLLGQCKNINEVMNGLDLHVLSSSYGEGFPNVVAEAMACGTPNVVTDVGDSAYVVGNTGWKVEPNDHIKLATAIEKSLDEIGTMKWNKRCKNARLRIRNKFGINSMMNNYSKIWKEVLKNRK